MSTTDRVREVQSLETTMDDVRAVMDAADSERKRTRRIEALEELRECLNLESLPLRISSPTREWSSVSWSS